METLILSWFVIVKTESVLLLTLFGSLQFLGTLAGPVFGVLGDRLGPRTMLCVLRAIYAALAVLVMVLAATAMLTPVWVFVVAALNGFFRPQDLVMRNAIIGATIPAGDRMSAIGLSRASTDSARVAGALTGAGLSALLGIASAYVFVTLFYAVSLALSFGIMRSPRAPDPTGTAHEARVSTARVWRLRDLTDGLRHVLTTPRLLAAMWLAFMINLTAYPPSHGLLPYAARHVYGTDATGLGWLVSSFAFGGLLASLTMVASGGARRPERPMLVFTALWYVLLLGFGHVDTLAGGMVILALAGYMQNIALISMTVSLLDAASETFRGRVMGVRTLAVYGLPIGLMVAGALIDRIGYPVTITVTSAIGLVSTVAIGFLWRDSIWWPGARMIPAGRAR